ncbi:MAG: DUF2357 domain-containing protein [Balneolales bacterium]
MSELVEKLVVPLEQIKEGLCLNIDQERDAPMFIINEAMATEYGESPWQLVEGHTYEYELTLADEDHHPYRLNCEYDQIVITSKRNRQRGRINPNIFVGTLELKIENSVTMERWPINLEVRSIKADYRTDYRFMLESITNHCTDLLLQLNAPVKQYYEPDFDTSAQTISQRFAFIQSLLLSDSFDESISRVLISPTTRWGDEDEERDVRNIRRFSNREIRQIATVSNRIQLPPGHHLSRQYGMMDAPMRVQSVRKAETVDTVENRFIKHVLEVYLKFCTDCRDAFERAGYKRREIEAGALMDALARYLNHQMFREVSRPATLRLNSPVLQRKSGYREILRTWLMFDLAAKLVWRGGEDVYEAGKRDVATLYEYWLFFELLDLVQSMFEVEPVSIDQLIVATRDGLGLQLRQGRHTPVLGFFKRGNRNLRVQFSYNRSFKGEQTYPGPGSWTKTLRPDYTLSIWPAELTIREAEFRELIVHIHFDAKYKIDRLAQIISEKDLSPDPDELEDESGIRDSNFDKEGNHTDFDKPESIVVDHENIRKETADEEVERKAAVEEKIEEAKGNYKNADLLKMHAYRDAIRRTGGAYVLYPGNDSDHPTFRGFHEIIPGLGAFAIRPKVADTGLEQLESFLEEVLKHFLNRTTQREKLAESSFQIHKEEPGKAFRDRVPEFIADKKLIPDQTTVVVGYFRNQAHLDWIMKNRLYNLRYGSDVRGGVRLTPEIVGASYLLLYGPGETATDKIFELSDDGPVIMSRKELLELGYPGSPDVNRSYLVYSIRRDSTSEFQGRLWKLANLSGFKTGRQQGMPIFIKLTELMGN